MTIKKRMILAFALMVLLFIAFSAISMIQMGSLGNLTSTLYNHPLRVSNAALKAKAGVFSMHRDMKDVFTSESQVAITMAIQKIKSEEKSIYQELSVIQAHILGKEGKDLIEKTTRLFTGWKPIRVEIEELIVKGDMVAANKIIRRKEADYVIRLEQKMSELTSYALNKADGFMKEAKKVENKILKQAIAFTAVLILIAVLIGFFISSSILSNVSSLKDTMTKISETGELVPSDLEGKNEITEMAEHFNILIEQLKRQFWLGESRNNLNRELSGELTYDQIVTKSIEHVSRNVDACAGALYAFNAKNSVCELKSSYAFVERTYLANKFNLGEGIVGQVAVEKKAILLKNIASREAVAQSGTVSQAPKAIYAIPLLHEKTLLGVFEIASFEEITQVKQQYLNSAANIISVLLHGASQNEQIKNLLKISQEANEKLQAQTEELQAQTGELQAMNEEFQQQADELKAQNIEVEAQRQQVEDANRLKSEFLSNMSHELRTPLNSVNALSRVLILQTKEKLSKEEMNYLEIIERNGKHLLSLINNILDLSKIEAGKMDITLSRFSVKTLIEIIIESVAPLTMGKKISIEQDFPGDLPKIESDESRIFQILENIIANAVKFTDKGHVKIAADNDGEHITIKVSDTGIGISEADLKSIFDEFRQVDGTSTRKFEGTGLGLAIAYKAAIMLGGNIDVESTLGVGSTFTVSLPIVYRGPKNILQKLEDNLQKLEDNFELSAEKTDKTEDKTILIVDDDPKVLQIISDAFIEQGYQTLTTTSGREAIKLARENQIFAITLDVIMPEMDGWEVLSQLKKDSSTSNIPVIIVSVSDDKKTGFALGAVGSITKPVDRKSLISEINKIYGYLPSSVMVVDDNEIDLKQSSQIIKLGKKGIGHNNPEQFKKNKILLIEDNDAVTIQVKKAVESIGISMDIAQDGQQGLDYIQHTIPKGIILDLMMPNIDGFEVLETIRGTQKTKDIPVLILTAKDLSKGDLHRLSSNNVQQLLQKGDVDLEDLLEKIKNMVDSPDQAAPQKRRDLEEAETSPPFLIKRDIPCILIVEDNPDNMTTIKAVIGPEYAIEEAVDGEKGLQKAIELLPDLILLDISLPKMNGITVVKKLKENEQTKRLPVIALTAQAMKGDREKLLGSGCDDYIAKPIEPEKLSEKLRKWTSRNV